MQENRNWTILVNLGGRVGVQQFGDYRNRVQARQAKNTLRRNGYVGRLPLLNRRTSTITH